MSIFNSLDRKIGRIHKAIKRTVAEVSTEECEVTSFGATEIDPAYLSVWVCARTDAERDRLSSDKNLVARLRYVFVTHDYPEAARDKVYISFASQEEVDRDWGGDWWQFIK